MSEDNPDGTPRPAAVLRQELADSVAQFKIDMTAATIAMRRTTEGLARAGHALKKCGQVLSAD